MSISRNQNEAVAEKLHKTPRAHLISAPLSPQPDRLPAAAAKRQEDQETPLEVKKSENQRVWTIKMQSVLSRAVKPYKDTPTTVIFQDFPI